MYLVLGTFQGVWVSDMPYQCAQCAGNGTQTGTGMMGSVGVRETQRTN